MRVLLVEDHDESREVLARLMRHWGFEVTTAERLASALECLETEFDVIISDIALPDGSGYALVNAAKRRYRQTLAIALSGYGSPMDVEIGRMAGFDHHLTKPFDCEQIRNLLATRQSSGATTPA